MKTTVLFKRSFLRTIIFILIVAYLPALRARSIRDSVNGLVFKNSSVKSGIDLKIDTACVFKIVAISADAIVNIDDFVKVASVREINHNAGGSGFADAFQPEVQSGGEGELYVFLITTTGRGGDLM